MQHAFSGVKDLVCSSRCRNTSILSHTNNAPSHGSPLLSSLICPSSCATNLSKSVAVLKRTSTSFSAYTHRLRPSPIPGALRGMLMSRAEIRFVLPSSCFYPSHRYPSQDRYSHFLHLVYRLASRGLGSRVATGEYPTSPSSNSLSMLRDATAVGTLHMWMLSRLRSVDMKRDW